MVQWRKRVVRNGDIELAAFELGDPANPPVILVHGWPDTHHLWTHVAQDLADDHLVVAYDTRGYGESSAPKGDAPYRLDRLAQDLFAVVDAVAGDRKAHLVAHDWGSLQAWEAVTTAGADEKIASYTSISGPNLDYLAEWARKVLSRPTPANLRSGISQIASSAYIGFFHLPVVPKAVFSAVGRPAVWRWFLSTVEGTDKSRIVLSDSFTSDAISGLRYYRANIRGKLANPDARDTAVPVMEIVNERDIALRPEIFSDTGAHAPNLWRRTSQTGHWLPYTNPGYLADSAREFIASVEGRAGDGVPQTMDRARVRASGPDAPLAGKLAVITGGGSGIGRETAYALAAQGAEIVLADIDLDGAAQTAAVLKERGATGHPYALNVADTAAFAEFAETVRKTHGVPDIVVNNAGIAVGGSALDASDDQLDKVVDVNLRGVMTGCRLFGRQMVERGTGGQIVNIASAAAFTPQRGLGIYAATKAGVLLFSESLRAELADARIGVTAICPGIVDTNIVANTPLAGFDDRQTEAAQRDRLVKFYQRRGYTPDRVAKQIVKAIHANKAVVPVTPEAAIGYRVYRFFPALSRLGARGNVFR
ncbi:putative peptidase S33 family protein [Gordonia araii NBRC 100433]|uniref:Putative peptidase S33 family protein n=1 Tax=Gordonia araii NBRC 100433 TaxID=1073574 RepID=G7H0Y2_9ACTN|nr:SDR family oxidoreductase [Gordonia araii]NNG97302.1 SDR family oxidoreductase [Gordonia araii NBRC 100433]GAB09507.1 putative peptidase S33 family protein [Gordonia araii NBRC 100433]